MEGHRPGLPILTITLNPTIDVSGDADTVRPTHKTRVSGTRYEPGGGGINVARVIKALGGDAEALYLAGGEMGNFLGRLLDGEGIRRHAFATAGQTRIAFMVRERSTGLEYRFVPQGSAVTAEEITACLDNLPAAPGGFIVASGSLPAGAPQTTYARIAKLATERGSRFVLDTSGHALQATLDIARPYLVKPSRSELEQFAGHDLDDHELTDYAQSLVKDGRAEHVAVTLGADGAILAGPEGVIRLPAIHVRVRSAVGAGDSFVGAIVWALAQGWEM